MLIFIISLCLFIFNLYIYKHTTFFNRNTKEVKRVLNFKILFLIYLISYILLIYDKSYFASIIWNIVFLSRWLIWVTICSVTCLFKDTCEHCQVSIIFNNKNIFDKIIIFLLKKCKIIFNKFEE